MHFFLNGRSPTASTSSARKMSESAWTRPRTRAARTCPRSSGRPGCRGTCRCRRSPRSASNLRLVSASLMPEDRGVEEEVLAAGELRVEARAGGDQPGDPAAGEDGARVGAHHAVDQLEQGALAGAVEAHQPDRLALLDGEGDVVDGEELVLSGWRRSVATAICLSVRWYCIVKRLLTCSTTIETSDHQRRSANLPSSAGEDDLGEARGGPGRRRAGSRPRVNRSVGQCPRRDPGPRARWAPRSSCWNSSTALAIGLAR